MKQFISVMLLWALVTAAYVFFTFFAVPINEGIVVANSIIFAITSSIFAMYVLFYGYEFIVDALSWLVTLCILAIIPSMLIVVLVAVSAVLFIVGVKFVIWFTPIFIVFTAFLILIKGVLNLFRVGLNKEEMKKEWEKKDEKAAKAV